MIDQERISPYNINTISTTKVMRVRININLGIISWSNIKKIILQTNIMRIVWQTVRRITNAILAVRGLKRLLRDERKRTKPLWCPRKATYLWWCIQSRTLGRSVYSLAIKNTISLTVSYNFIYYLIVEIRMCLTCENRDSLLNFFLDFFKIWTNKNTGSQNLKDIYKTVRWC